MPYRRLPKTDAARLKALEALTDNNDVYTVAGRFIDRNSLAKAQKLYALLSDACGQHATSMRTQVRYSKRMANLQHNAMTYISHFIQVLFLAVERGEVPEDCLKEYGIKPDEKLVPYLKTAEAIMQWGTRVIQAERKRVKEGGKPILSPSIGAVATHFDVFKEKYNAQRQYKNKTAGALADIDTLRPQVDEVILDLWNQIEKHFENEPPEKKYQLCKKYGVVYYYRRHEKHLEE
ncbi:MAG: hypothetical protein J5529_02530 [Prevotella sp.]|nr:hypothetical protein [Prevotella sp.]